MARPPDVILGWPTACQPDILTPLGYFNKLARVVLYFELPDGIYETVPRKPSDDLPNQGQNEY